MHSLIKIFHPIDHFFTLFVIFTLSCNSVWYADIVVVTSTSVSLYFNCCINELKKIDYITETDIEIKRDYSKK